MVVARPVAGAVLGPSAKPPPSPATPPEDSAPPDGAESDAGIAKPHAGSEGKGEPAASRDETTQKAAEDKAAQDKDEFAPPAIEGEDDGEAPREEKKLENAASTNDDGHPPRTLDAAFNQKHAMLEEWMIHEAAQDKDESAAPAIEGEDDGEAPREEKKQENAASTNDDGHPPRTLDADFNRKHAMLEEPMIHEGLVDNPAGAIVDAVASRSRDLNNTYSDFEPEDLA